MARPKDEDGLPMAAAHSRLTNADQLRERCVFALTECRAAVILTMKRKLRIANRAIDYVFDGGKESDTNPEHIRAMSQEVWNSAVAAVKSVPRSSGEMDHD